MIFRVAVPYLVLTLPSGCDGLFGPVVPDMRWVNETRFVDGEAYLLSYDPKGSICSNERGAQGNPVFSDGPEGRDVPGVCLTHGDAQTVSVYRQDKNVMPLESLDFARDLARNFCWKVHRFRRPEPSSEMYWGSGWVFYDPCY